MPKEYSFWSLMSLIMLKTFRAVWITVNNMLLDTTVAIRVLKAGEDDPNFIS